MTRRQGIVFAAHGERHVIAARRAARSLRPFAGDLPIDLFADRPVSDPVFARVHRLYGASHRPKIEALFRSRFARTLYLDNDIIAVGDITDIFALLDRHHILGAHESYRNSDSSLIMTGPNLPPAFPEVNSGVLAIRRSLRMRWFLYRWRKRFRASGVRLDQPALREMLWHSRLRLGILPPDYNLMHTRSIVAMGDWMTAPRLLHVTWLLNDGRDPGDPETPFDPAAILSAPVYKRLRELIDGDRTRARAEPRRPDKFEVD
ncbi:MAG: LPS:glycosyltransferase [Rhodobacteraceae bacterium HLUCCA08]|nr:MAG: LPS:glycosyltransferase [Rhodobacteraceae bacterium HLUCCA08]